MALEATKNLSGARQMVRSLTWELDTISDYTSPSFNRIGGGTGGQPSDRVARMLTRKEQLQNKLSSMLDLCLYIEEAAHNELETVESLELRSLIIDRIIRDRSWTDIAKEYGDTTPDALKKRFERGLKAYEEQRIPVPYSLNAKKAIAWLNKKMRVAGIANPKELKKTSVDYYNGRKRQEIIDFLNQAQSTEGEVTPCTS